MWKNYVAIGFAIPSGAISALKLFPVFFEDRDEFIQAITYTLIPDWYSLLRGQLWRDWEKSWKLGLYLIGINGVALAVWLLVGWLIKDV
ncbi:MAG: hypothetical protein ACRC8A_13265 [Microcoleaceae cyanobacterium]